MIQRLNSAGLLLLMAVMISSCFPSRKGTRPRPLSEIRPEVLIQRMDSARFEPEWLSARLSAEVVIKEKPQAFTASLRLRKDSLLL